MLGRKNHAQMDLFITGSLERLIPEDHILARVNRVLDLSWLRGGGGGLLLRGQRSSWNRPRSGGFG